jgi:voltage-gated potassium channel
LTAASEPSPNPSQLQTPRPENRRQLVIMGLLRTFAVTTVLVAIYYLAPLDHTTHIPGWLSLTVALLALGALTAYQLRAIMRADHPGVRAVEALATTAPLFLLLFSATYFLMAKDSAANFNVHALTRTDALYFTITVFATVGFGDIAAASQKARIIVMVQMILDLVVIGLVVRLFLGAVQHARQKDPNESRAGTGPDPDHSVAEPGHS